MTAIMDHYYTDSRGSNLRFPKLNVLPGAKINTLVDEAIKAISIVPDSVTEIVNPDIVYIIGGIPDATHRIEDDDYNYQEVVFMDSAYQGADRLIREYESASTRIQSAGAIPVFSTIPPMNLEIYNHYRLSRGNTSHLIHFKYYDDMQTLLESALAMVNRHILEMNEANQMITPNLAGYITCKRGMRQGYRYRYNKLYDGCHPVSSVKGKWQRALETISSLNRQVHSGRHIVAEVP